MILAEMVTAGGRWSWRERDSNKESVTVTTLRWDTCHSVVYFTYTPDIRRSSMASVPSTSVYPQPLYVVSEDLAKLLEERTNEGLFDLTDGEKWWRDRSDLFEQHGYMLRPRFRPGWKPSWLGTNLHPLSCEDSYNLGVRLLLWCFNVPHALNCLPFQATTNNWCYSNERWKEGSDQERCCW